MYGKFCASLQDGGVTSKGQSFAPRLRKEGGITKKPLVIRPHQMKVAKHLMLKNKPALVMDHAMGAGKTVSTAVCIAAQIIMDPKASTLVVVPLATLQQWQFTMQEWLLLDDGDLLCTQKLDPTAKLARVTIVTWEALRIAFTSCHEAIKIEAEDAKGRLRKKIAWRATKTAPRHVLFAREWGMVFFDEVQKARNKQSQLCNAAMALQSAKFIGLSGTPVENSAVDFCGLVATLHIPDEDFRKDNAFSEKDLVKHGAIRAFSQRYVHTVTKEALNLPRLKVEAVYYDVEFSESSVQVYSKALQEAIKLQRRMDADGGSRQDSLEFLVRITRMQHMMLSPLLATRGAAAFSADHTLYTLAVDEDTACMRAFWGEIQRFCVQEGHKRVVVTANKVVPLRIFRRYLERHPVAAGVQLFEYDGSMSLKKRVQVQEEFLTCEAGILFLSMQAGGVGLNLVPGCQAMLVVPPWPWMKPDQVCTFAQGSAFTEAQCEKPRRSCAYVRVSVYILHST